MYSLLLSQFQINNGNYHLNSNAGKVKDFWSCGYSATSWLLCKHKEIVRQGARLIPAVSVKVLLEFGLASVDYTV